MAANRASLLKVHRLLMFDGVRKVVAKWLKCNGRPDDQGYRFWVMAEVVGPEM
jgi:hypothetical protein